MTSRNFLERSMMKTTIFRSNCASFATIALVGAVLAPTFAFAQDLTPTRRAAPAMTQTRTPAPTLRPGEFYAAPYVERIGGPPNAGNIVGTGDVPAIPLTERD